MATTHTAYKKFLSPTEQQAISKVLKMRQPMLRELEKWTEQREKLETKILDHINMLGKTLEPFYKQSQIGRKFLRAAVHSVSARHPNKKASSRKKSRAKKPR